MMTKLNRNKPYNDLPLLPPNQVLETTKVLRKTIEASRSLAQLNGMLTNLPNPNLFIDSIHLQEAKASSEIENFNSGIEKNTAVKPRRYRRVKI